MEIETFTYLNFLWGGLAFGVVCVGLGIIISGTAVYKMYGTLDKMLV